MAVVIISAILSIPQTAGGSNEFGVASAQCLAYPNAALCTGKKTTINQNEYYCFWNSGEGKCLAQQLYCNYSAPVSGYFAVGDPPTVPITISFSGFSDGQPSDPTLSATCGNITLNCSGGSNGQCTSNCNQFDSSNPIETVTLSNGTQQSQCNAFTFNMEWCGDGICGGQFNPTENCPIDATTGCPTNPSTCQTLPATCLNGCDYTDISFGNPDGIRCDSPDVGCTGGSHCVCDGRGNCCYNYISSYDGQQCTYAGQKICNSASSFITCQTQSPPNQNCFKESQTGVMCPFGQTCQNGVCVGGGGGSGIE